MGGSVVAIYWMQSATSIRHLDFWFPTASLALTVLVWAATRAQAEDNPQRSLSSITIIAAILITAIIVTIGLTRYLGPLCCLSPSRPPDILRIAAVIALVGTFSVIIIKLSPKSQLPANLLILLILLLFLALKTDPGIRTASLWLRTLTGQSKGLATTFDLPWLGFSFLAFRLLHVLRDYQTRNLPTYSLREFVTYAVFFPAYTAGPIDRAQHFVDDLRKAFTFSSGDARAGGQRLVMGAFKKFVLADSLAIFSLNEINAAQTTSTLWTWVLLYTFALRIYFDFSGYTDIAIGLGQLMGVNLPENFDRPYLKPNLTAFWNSWHITLAQWFRSYFFNPLTRAMRTSRWSYPTSLIIFTSQLSTMILIGLWHGITWNFLLWGAWHGLGLFAHNRWTAYTRPRLAGLDEQRPLLARVSRWGSTFLTFNYVTLGWVWFAMPTIGLSLQVFSKLFDI
jgi:D-alanyl-lipoteichoic acid acyltransferase DltB (MBOAT superfamily)